MATQSEVLQKFPMRAFIVGLIYNVIIVSTRLFADQLVVLNYCSGDYVDSSAQFMPWVWVLTYMFLFVFINKWLKFSASEIALIMFMIIAPMGLYNGYANYLYALFTYPCYMQVFPKTYPDQLAKMTWLFPWNGGGKWEDFYYPNGWIGRPQSVDMWASVRWDLIGTAIVWNVAQMLSLILMSMFVIAIIRRQWVEVESLPFPNVALANLLVTSATETDKTKTESWIKRNKWLLIGILVGEVMLVGGWLDMVNRAFMGRSLDLSLLKVNTAADNPNINLMIPYFPLTLMWQSPAGLGFSLMMPIDVLISFFIVFLIAVIIWPNLAVSAGIWATGPSKHILQGWSGYWLWSALRLIPNSPGGGSGWAAVAWGVLFAGALWPLVVGRKEIMASIRAISKPSPETEKNEVLSYKYLWIGAIVSGIVFLALLAPTGAILWVVALFTILSTLIWVGTARFTAETGGWGGFARDGFSLLHTGGAHQHWAVRALLYNTVGDPRVNDPGSYVNQQIFYTIKGTNWFSQQAPGYLPPTTLLMEGFSLAALTKLRNRDLFIGMATSIVVAFIVGVPLSGWLAAGLTLPVAQGPNTSAANFELGIPIIHNTRDLPPGDSLAWYYGWPYGDVPMENFLKVIATWIIGIAIAFICYWLRSRYPKFIFHPMAIVLAFGITQPPWGEAGRYLLVAAVALAAKYLVTRYYGAKAFEEKVKPFALGSVIAPGILYIITLIVATLFNVTTGTRYA
ncbi:MAG: DUF6785 family protein [Candidatus Bathyarchaeia archaeon]